MGTLRLWLADIRQLADREQTALSLLTPERRAAAERIKPEQDRLHCIAAGLLLRHVLGVTSDEALCRNEYGRPQLTGEGPCFNLSHGGSYAVLAVYPEPVGVDIEPVGDKLPISIPRRYLRPDELEWLEAETTPERFARLWTRLESALKADGRGFGMEDREFSVMDDSCPWQIRTFLFDGHTISCAAGERFEIQIERLSAEKYLEQKSP